MAVIKVYTRINWLNKSESLTTPLGKTNLNKMDKAINLIDDEVVSMSAKIDEIDTTKVSADQLNNMVTDVSFNDKNGVISITKHNGTVLNIDTAMEKIAVNFEYNAQTQQLILTLENGEKQYIDMSALITQYEFKDTDTIAFSIDSDGKVSASIKSGSITKAMLSSEVMSAITLSENNAAASAQAAAQSATNAELDSKMSQSYAVGKSGIRDGEDTDNSKYYSEQAKKYADEAQEIAGGNFIPASDKGVAGGVAVLDNNLAVAKAVGDEEGNNIKSTYAKKNEIPDGVKVDGKTITKDENGVLHGSSNITVDPILNESSENPIMNKAVFEALAETEKDLKGIANDAVEEAETTSYELMNVKMLGWTVPRKCPIQNEVNGNRFVQKVGRVDLGDVQWVLDSASFYTSALSSIIKGVDNNSLIANIYLKGYTTVARNDLANETICLVANTNTIRLIDNSYNNTIAFKQAMQGQYLYYELAIPITKTIDGNEIGEVVNEVRKDVDSKVSKSSVANNLVTTEEGYALDARQGQALNDAIASLKKSVSDGKSAIASAITAKGVSTASDASFATMTTNIKNISTGVNPFELLKDNKLEVQRGYTSDYISRLVSSNAYQGGGYPYSHSDGAINVWYVCPTNGGAGLLDNRYILYDYIPGATYSGYRDYFSIKIYDKTTGETKTYNNVTSVSLGSSFKLDNNSNQIIKISK